MHKTDKKALCLIAALILVLLLMCAGCRSNTAQSSKPAAMTADSSQAEQLKSEIDELKNTINGLKSENADLSTQLQSAAENADTLVLQNYKDKYAWFDKFDLSTKWDKIVIGEDINGADCVSVTDPQLIQSIGLMFHIRREVTKDYGNMILSDIRCFTYKLIGKDITIIFHVRGRGIIEFDELPGHYFQVDENIHQPGNAFLKKPGYLPEETLEGKMAESGLMMQEKEGLRPWFQAFRIKNTIYSFRSIDKKAIGKPAVLPAEYIERFTFYYFNEKCHMTLYNNMINIKNNKSDLYYKAKEEDIRSILSILNAN